MTLITNGRLITRNPAEPFFQKGGVVVDGDFIVAVGEEQVLRKQYPQAQILDARGGVIMPGLINCHEHIYSSFARGLSLPGHNPKTFSDILSGMWWRIDRALTNEDTHFCAWASYLDAIKNGVTTVFDHHASYGQIEGSLSTIAQVAATLGVRTCLCFEVSDRDGDEKAHAAILENAAFIAACGDSAMHRGMMGLHASFTLSDKTLETAMAHAAGMGAHIHVAEGADDARHCLETYGTTIVERLHRLGVLGEKTIAAHCIHITQDDAARLAATNTAVAHNPQSNMGNAVGVTPLNTLLAQGVLCGMGTDGYTHDMLESYKTANLIHKHHSQNPNAAWSEVPLALFDHNPQIACRHFSTPLGVLSPGYAADIIIADYDPLTPMTGDNLNSHILFGITGRHVTTTMVAGRVLMENRELKGIDEAEIWAGCRQQAAQFWNRV